MPGLAKPLYGQKLYRGFESPPLRQKFDAVTLWDSRTYVRRPKTCVPNTYFLGLFQEFGVLVDVADDFEVWLAPFA